MFFDYFLDLVAYAPRFVDSGYHATLPDLKAERGSEAVVVVIGVFCLTLEMLFIPVALVLVADIGID